MGHSKISITIPDEVYQDLKAIVTDKKIKISHLVTEAIVEKIKKIKEDAYVKKVNKAYEDPEVQKEQRFMADLVAENTDLDELPW